MPLLAAKRRCERAGRMGTVIISMMLVCAVLASLAFGVLTAYGLCLAFFRLVRMHGPTANPVRLEPQAAEAASKL